MLRVFLNPGHAPDGNPDPGASNRITGLQECDVAKNIADLVEKYLVAAGVEVVGNLQSDSLYEVVQSSNNLGADVFISIHCNAFNEMANGTEVWHYHTSRDGKKLAECIQRQIVLPRNDRPWSEGGCSPYGQQPVCAELYRRYQLPGRRLCNNITKSEKPSKIKGLAASSCFFGRK